MYVPLQEEQKTREAEEAKKTEAAQMSAAIERERQWKRKMHEAAEEKARMERQMREAEEKKKREQENEAHMAALKIQKVNWFNTM